MTNADRIEQAARKLVEAPSRQYSPLRTRVLRTVEEMQAGIPLRFEGDLEPLNALVELAMKEPARFDKVMDLVDRHRAAKMSVPTPEQRLRKNLYMKEFMRRKRAKLAQERRYPSIGDDVATDIAWALRSGKPAKKPAAKKLHK